MRSMRKTTLFTGTMVLAAASVAMGQGPGAPPPMHGIMGPHGVPVGVEGRTVTGSPFSAEIVSSSSQTLADGSHIAHNSTTRVARDGQGRTFRQEGDTPEKSVTFLHDPVGHTAHVISAGDKTARLSRLPEHERGPRRLEGPPPQGQQGPRPESRPMHVRQGETVETLAPQNIEGVWAEGTRITRTIPVGAIGNDRELKVVSESWYSKDLQMVVMSKHSDPRTGESSVHVTHIQRGEPDAALFQVPAGYKVIERGHGR